MIESWKDIKGYEGMYQVSNLGRVKSCIRVVNAGANCNHDKSTIPERILKVNHSGKYCQVILSKNGKVKAKTVHRLVAEAFIPNVNNFPCINHRDENKHNNRVDNLEWCTYKYNNEYNHRVERCRDKISNTLKGRKSQYILTDMQRKHISDSAKRGWIKRKNRLKEV